jgi:hypothetical protein
MRNYAQATTPSVNLWKLLGKWWKSCYNLRVNIVINTAPCNVFG